MRISVRMTRSQRFLALCIVAGVICGLIGVSFHLAIGGVFGGLWTFYSGLGWMAWPAMMLSPALAGLMVGLLLHYIEPRAAGSGIPQTKAAFHLGDGVIRGREAVWRFIAGVISVGGGNSLGREGPTVHICSAACSKIGRWFRLDAESARGMIPVGMGAGISAAFNAPIAAVMFVIEELLDDFSSATLGGILIAVVVAAVVERTLLGEHGVLQASTVEFATAPWMLISLVLGPVAGLVGHAFVTLLLRARATFRQWQSIPGWMRPALGGLSVGLIGVTVVLFSGGHSGIFSIGLQDLTGALTGQLGLHVLLLLLAGKFAATIICYASGSSGGIFAPVMFIGAMLGGVFGVILVELLDVDQSVLAATALLGTGAFFAAVIRCPITSILIIFEMTRNYSLILPLMVGNLVAFAIASRLRSIPVYDALLLQDGVNLRDLPKYRGDRNWKQVPVEAIMTSMPRALEANLTAAENLAAVESDGDSHRSYPVTEGDGGRVVGMVTHFELRTLAKHTENPSLGDLVAGRKLVILHPQLSVKDAINELLLNDAVRAPVVSDDDEFKLLGMITVNDIVRQQNVAKS